jgi:hypothetical protein
MFSGIYYDGKSSRAHQASVQLNPKNLTIEYFPDDDFSKKVVWQIDNIHKNEFNTEQKVILQYGSFPFQTLEVNSQSFFQTLYTNYSGKKLTLSIAFPN